MRAILLSAVALTIVALYAMPAAAQNQTDGGDTPEVEFEDQTVENDMVVVARAVLPEGGFVVIHDMSTQDDQDQTTDNTQNIIGVSEFLEAGEHMDVGIQIDAGTTGGTTTGDTGQTPLMLTAMLHMDTNDNEEFDFEDSDGQDDGPYMEGGGAVTDDAQVTMEDEGDDGLDQPGDDGFGDGQDGGDGDGDGDVGDGQDEDTPGFEAVALLALLGAVAVLRRR